MLRRPHPIVQVVQRTASELNDLLNAIVLRIALLRHQLGSSSIEAEIARLATLVDTASLRLQQLEQYTRAEELVARMRRPRKLVRGQESDLSGTALLSFDRPRTSLLIAEASLDAKAIKECLERSGFKVTLAESSAEGLAALQSDTVFDHVVCDSAFISGSDFGLQLSRAASASHVYVLQRRERRDRLAV